MLAGDRILVALDAHECWARGTRASGAKRPARAASSKVEPVVVGGGQDTFGWSGSDLSDAIVNWQKRMSDLAANYTKLTPVWSAKDSAGFTDWTNDYKALQARYAPALANAQSVAASTFGWGTDAAFDALAKAMRLSYPPDGGPVAKGDYDDLYARLSAAARTLGNLPLVSTPLTQPTGTDLGMAFYKATAGVDVIAQAAGQEQPKLPGTGTAAHFWAWLVRHQKGVMIGSAAVVGGVLMLQLAPLLMMPVKVAKGLAAVAA